MCIRDSRKRLLEYDDVMNSQRNVIYTRRRHALMGERIGLDVLNTIYDTSSLSVEYAMGELEKNKGTQFDPEVADAFIELIKEGKVPL